MCMPRLMLKHHLSFSPVIFSLDSQLLLCTLHFESKISLLFDVNWERRHITKFFLDFLGYMVYFGVL